QRIQKPELRASYDPIAARYRSAIERRKSEALSIVDARHSGDARAESQAIDNYRRAQADVDRARNDGAKLVEASGGEHGFRVTTSIFLSFVPRSLPSGIVGLVIAVILAAPMSSSSGEINSLATVSVVDIYRRHFHKQGTDHHYLTASRVATA